MTITSYQNKEVTWLGYPSQRRTYLPSLSKQVSSHHIDFHKNWTWSSLSQRRIGHVVSSRTLVNWLIPVGNLDNSNLNFNDIYIKFLSFSFLTFHSHPQWETPPRYPTRTKNFVKEYTKVVREGAFLDDSRQVNQRVYRGESPPKRVLFLLDNRRRLESLQFDHEPHCSGYCDILLVTVLSNNPSFSRT